MSNRKSDRELKANINMFCGLPPYPARERFTKLAVLALVSACVLALVSCKSAGDAAKSIGAAVRLTSQVPPKSVVAIEAFWFRLEIPIAWLGKKVIDSTVGEEPPVEIEVLPAKEGF